ncbi:hypothetical protein HRbin19_01297 [bacterium HR19]|nr:hypothetical protein HRbin19_01297 [bacterium HR19]
MKHKIELRYWKDCPSWPIAIERLKEIINELKSQGHEIELTLYEVRTDEEAEELRFPGSPTILVDGKDIDEEGARQNPVGLTCRVYNINGKILPVPPLEFIRERIISLLKGK